MYYVTNDIHGFELYSILEYPHWKVKPKEGGGWCLFIKEKKLAMTYTDQFTYDEVIVQIKKDLFGILRDHGYRIYKRMHEYIK